jgi:hypothetical protein
MELERFMKKKAVKLEEGVPMYSFLTDEFYGDWDAVFYELEEDCGIVDPTREDLERMMLAPCERTRRPLLGWEPGRYRVDLSEPVVKDQQREED